MQVICLVVSKSWFNRKIVHQQFCRQCKRGDRDIIKQKKDKETRQEPAYQSITTIDFGGFPFH